ncbi:putative cysteine synthase [Maudiozyma humilis]|uniref:cysteine synthase n=1 Tax=Maudiozyma humilis TaxID=51915 RepID=A0AAV5S518_MAUHU|nr:putative cysteine synthase [Kazachstania humilis]
MSERSLLHWQSAVAAICLGTAAFSAFSLWSLRKQLRDGEVPPAPAMGVEMLIGNTPLVQVRSLSRATGCTVYAKLELANPAGSAKDRVALNIVRAAEQQGLLVPGEPGWVFEGTSGSTGISIAMICNALGYRAHISLPDDTSPEKLALLESLGAVVNKVKPASIVDPDQYVNAAKKACERMVRDEGVRGVFADQFENDANWRVHYATTGPEIFQQTSGNIDCLVAGCGTGGTITGVARYLKERKGLWECHVVLADPQGSGFYNRVNHGVMYDSVEQEGTRRRHQVDTIVEGVGLNRITHNFRNGEQFVDEAVRVSDQQAVRMAKFLSVNDGLFVGSSTAVNAVAAVRMARELPKGATIVIIACDSGSRHLSKFWKEAKAVEREISLEEVMQ